MLRRSFLGALMGLAAAPSLAKLAKSPELSTLTLVEVEKELDDLTEHPFLAKEGMITRIDAYSMAGIGSAALWKLRRAEGFTVLEGALNSGGGTLTWKAPIGNEIIFTSITSLVVDLPKDLIMSIYYGAKGNIPCIRTISEGKVSDIEVYQRIAKNETNGTDSSRDHDNRGGSRP